MRTVIASTRWRGAGVSKVTGRVGGEATPPAGIDGTENRVKRRGGVASTLYATATGGLSRLVNEFGNASSARGDRAW